MESRIRWLALAAFLAAGAGAALLNTLGDLAGQPYWVARLTPVQIFIRFLPAWLIAAILGFGLRELIVRRRLFWNRSRGSVVMVHLLGAALFPLVHLYLLAWAHVPFAGSTSFRVFDDFLGMLPRYYLLGVATYVAAAAAIHAVEYGRAARERELQALALEASLADARLAALRQQLSPHFLFNALNTVAMLIRQDRSDDALATLAKFGDLMRDVLRETATHLVPLQDELAFIRRYLEVERIRFHDRLTIEVRSEELLESVAVPHLILQPLVENALHHGISPRPGPGRVEVVAETRRGSLRLTVSDDGVGLPVGWNSVRHLGVGLENTRARLSQLYRGAGDLEIARGPDGGVRAVVTLPLGSPVELAEALG